TLTGTNQADESMAALIPVPHVQSAHDVGPGEGADSNAGVELRPLQAIDEISIHPSEIQKRGRLQLDGIIEYPLFIYANAFFEINQIQIVVDKPVQAKPAQRVLPAKRRPLVEGDA